jgi:hypothetical protein
MSAVPVQSWRDLLRNIDQAVVDPSWDFVVYCRFLADRLPESGSLTGAEFALLAEELVNDLQQGVDRRTQKTFDPPLVSGRSDLLYNYFRAKLVDAGKKTGGEDYAKALAAALKPVLPAPPPASPPAEPATAAVAAVPDAGGKPTPAPASPAPAE